MSKDKKEAAPVAKTARMAKTAGSKNSGGHMKGSCECGGNLTPVMVVRDGKRRMAAKCAGLPEVRKGIEVVSPAVQSCGTVSPRPKITVFGTA